jgi:hypothetical protein
MSEVFFFKNLAFYEIEGKILIKVDFPKLKFPTANNTSKQWQIYSICCFYLKKSFYLININLNMRLKQQPGYKKPWLKQLNFVGP